MNSQYRLTDPRAAAKCAEHILNDVPHDGRCLVEIRQALRPRTLPQNSRYWATLTEELRQLAAIVAEISAHTGYTVLEVRRLIAEDLPPEQVALLFVQSPEAAHEILKIVHGIKTSTRLGTKEFMEYEDRMLQTFAEVVGMAQAVSGIAIR